MAIESGHPGDRVPLGNPEQRYPKHPTAKRPRPPKVLRPPGKLARLQRRSRSARIPAAGPQGAQLPTSAHSEADGEEGPPGIPRESGDVPLKIGLRNLLDRNGLYESILGVKNAADMVVLKRSFPGFATANVVKNLDALLAREATEVSTFNLDHRGQVTSPCFSSVEVAPGRHEVHLTDGVRVLRDRQGRTLIVTFCPSEVPFPDLPHICRVRAARKDLAAAQEFMAKLDLELRENHIFRGQKIRLHGRGCEFLDVKARGWEDAFFDPQIVGEVKRNILLPLEKIGEFRRHSIPVGRGVLLHGPPGTGKSLISTICANAVNATTLLISQKDASSPEDVKLIYELARDLAPTLVIWEDFELAATDRTSGDLLSKRIVGELLVQLDSLEAKAEVITLATTNFGGALDKALLRPGRIDRQIYVGPPGRESRAKILAIALSSREIPGARDIDLKSLAERTEGFSGAQLVELVTTAVIEAIQEANGSGPILRMENFEAALKRVNGSNGTSGEPGTTGVGSYA